MDNEEQYQAYLSLLDNLKALQRTITNVDESRTNTEILGLLERQLVVKMTQALNTRMTASTTKKKRRRVSKKQRTKRQPVNNKAADDLSLDATALFAASVSSVNDNHEQQMSPINVEIEEFYGPTARL